MWKLKKRNGIMLSQFAQNVAQARFLKNITGEIVY